LFTFDSHRLLKWETQIIPSITLDKYFQHKNKDAE
jgi:hypothetical protein